MPPPNTRCWKLEPFVLQDTSVKNQRLRQNRQNDTTCLLHPGDFALIDSAVPSEFVFFGEYTCQLSLHLPRAEMNARFDYELIPGGIALPRQDATTMSISAAVAKVLSRDASGTVADGYLREALFGLFWAPCCMSGRHKTDTRAWTAILAALGTTPTNTCWKNAWSTRGAPWMTGTPGVGQT